MGTRTERCIAAALAAAETVGLTAATADVLQDTHRIVLRLAPCDTVVRLHDVHKASGLEFELAAAREVLAASGPVADPDSRAPEVLSYDGFAMTFWKYFEPTEPRPIDPSAYGSVLSKLHAAMRQRRSRTGRALGSAASCTRAR